MMFCLCSSFPSSHSSVILRSLMKIALIACFYKLCMASSQVDSVFYGSQVVDSIIQGNPMTDSIEGN